MKRMKRVFRVFRGRNNGKFIQKMFTRHTKWLFRVFHE